MFSMKMVKKQRKILIIKNKKEKTPMLG